VPKRILVIGTGGTISAVADAHAAAAGGLDVEVLGRAVRTDLADLASMEYLDLCRIASRDITPGVMWTIADAIRRGVDDGIDGAVVTHGTDTLEETAYALAVMTRANVPVVVTGAMRLPGRPGADGDANLRAAVIAACDPRLAATAPVVLLSDELHLARTVAKTHTTRIGAFTSPGSGPIGSLVEDRVHLVEHLGTNTDYLGLPDRPPDYTVELLWMTAGTDGYLLRAAAERAAGIVLAGTGGGHVPARVAATLRDERIAEAVPVVIASRTGAGPMLNGTYGLDGGEEHLRSLGALQAGDLTPLKARIRLELALSLGLAPERAFPAG
jgi:L-asparaginase